MNKEDFENRLATLLKAQNAVDPTPSWKTEILARALSDHHAVESKRRMLPPRWLMVSLSVAWAAAIALNLVTPEAEMLPHPTTSETAHLSPTSRETLFAHHRQMSLNLDSFE